MPYYGWMQLAGVEIFNTPRTVAYARDIAPSLNLDDCDECDDLAVALGDGEYRSPLLDQPDWFDPNNPDTWNFAGFLPLSVRGLTDSTRTASTVGSVQGGGVTGRTRHGAREIRVSGILVAADQCALDVGMEWFKKALEGNGCAGCAGDDLCFLSCCPEITPGAVDPDSEPVTHPIPLNIGWNVDKGRWTSGRWRVPSTPAHAYGPLLDPPCDEVTYSIRVSPRDGQKVRLLARTEDGTTVAESPVVLLQRTNWALDPDFGDTSAQNWTPGNGVTLQIEDNAGSLSLGQDLSAGATVVTGDGTTADPGQEFSGRLTAEMDPTGLTWTNLVPNPAVRTLGGWDDEATRDTSLFYTDTGSARVETQNDGANTIGSISYGADDDQYAIRVDGGETYTVGAWVNTNIDASVVVGASWFDESGTLLGYGVTPAQPVSANTWTRVTVTPTVSDTAARLQLAFSAEPASGTASTGDRLNVDALMVSPQSPLHSYFDGSYPDARWTGLQHSSPSVLDPGAEEACVQLQITVGGSTALGDPVTLTPGQPVDLTTGAASDPAGGPVSVQLVSCASIAQGTTLIATRGLIEAAPTPGPWFDGYTENADGYEYRWAGVANQASSIQRYNAPIEVTAPSGAAPVQPVIEAVNGDDFEITSVTASYRDEVDQDTCIDDSLRTLREVTVVDGPRIIEEFDTGCDAAAVRVEFLMVADVPWVHQILQAEYRVVELGGGLGEITVPANDGCDDVDDTPLPINDPNCPLPPAPPRPPKPDDCLEDVNTYTRRAVAVPGDIIAPWQDGVPVVELKVNTSEAVRQARVRFYPNPLDRTNLNQLEPCAFCGEFVVSYIPGNSTLTIDGMTERATITLPGDDVRDATHLLYGTDSGPMLWPLLSCGLPYIMTVDTAPTTTDVLATSMQLVVRS